MSTKKKALVAMSGGVDSSMTALLMQQAGYDCVGVHMRLLEESNPDMVGAKAIAEKLDMPFYEHDLSDAFRVKVIEPFVQGYEMGETPNPCIFCNRHLKFSALLDIADELGCEVLATGHYARVEFDEKYNRWVARTGLDETKDQSYVLYTLSQEQLERVVLPLGQYRKTEIREMAQEAGFHNADKKDSQNICFVPDDDYAGYIESVCARPSVPGDMLELDGRVVGQHRGLIHYTIGQRKGLGPHGRPVFVQKIDIENNTLTIGDDDSTLYHRDFYVRDTSWIALPDAPKEPLSCTIKIGYKHAFRSGTIQLASNEPEPGQLSDKHSLGNDPGAHYLHACFDDPQRAITPGQAAVFFDGDIVLGGGTIDSVGFR
jgi:tRNA-specific 2-thiouridylase